MEYIYSDSLNEMVIKAFMYKGIKYEWHDLDCIYYSTLTDADWFDGIPKDAKII